MNVNFDQLKSGLVSVLMLVGMYLVGNKTFTSEQWTTITNNVMIAIPALIAVGGMLYKIFQHTDAKTVAAVIALPDDRKVAAVAALPDQAILAAANAMPGVAVMVAPSASAGAQAAAADPNLPNVTKA